MDESTIDQTSENVFVNKYGFPIFIMTAIIISAVIVLISMAMYNSSGAAQLDLSRPGYKSVRSQAGKDDSDFQAYSASGPISKSVIDSFKAQYESQAKKIESVNAFGGDPLSPDALGLNPKTTD
jgi:hypothetical protein